MTLLTILIVSDGGLVALGLEAMVRQHPDMALAGTAENGAEGLLRTRLSCPDLVVLCASDPSSQHLQLCEEIQRQSPSTHILVVCGDRSPAMALRYLICGATGYILDCTPTTQILNDIQRVGLGETVVRGIAIGVSPGQRPRAGAEEEVDEAMLVDLSNSELNILRMLAHGRTNKEIARSLSLSLATVKWHLGRIYAKLGLSSRSEAISFALRSRVDRSA